MSRNIALLLLLLSVLIVNFALGQDGPLSQVAANARNRDFDEGTPILASSSSQKEEGEAGPWAVVGRGASPTGSVASLAVQPAREVLSERFAPRVE